jgi:ribosomal protein S14
MGNAAEDILNGPGYFKCERHKLRMKKGHCVDWQTPGAEPFEFDKSIVECANCEQGKKIAEEIGERSAALEERGAPHSGLRINNKLKTKEEKMIIKCKRCGERPAMLRQSGAVVNGLCRECHGEARHSGKSKRKYNKRVVAEILQPSLPAVIINQDNSETYKAAAVMFIRSIERKVVDAIKVELEERGA